MDAIIVRDLLASAHIGVPEEERAQPQNVLISFEVSLDLALAAETDELEHTLDYGTLVGQVAGVAGERPVKLLEHLAHRVATFLLGLPGVQQVSVEVAKEVAPIPQTVGRVSMRLVRGT